MIFSYFVHICVFDLHVAHVKSQTLELKLHIYYVIFFSKIDINLLEVIQMIVSFPTDMCAWIHMWAPHQEPNLELKLMFTLQILSEICWKRFDMLVSYIVQI